MRTVTRLFLPALAVALVVGFGAFHAQEKPKYTIETVMEKAHEEDVGIYFKVVAGKATKDEKATLLDLYKALGMNKPNKGDAKSWKEKTDVLIAAAEAAVKEDKEAVAKLKKAADCMGCHKAHNPN